MLKKISIAFCMLLSLGVNAKELVYKNTYDLPYWGGNPYTPMAISRVEANKSSPNQLNAQYILGLQDREFYNNETISKVLSTHAKPLYLFNNWFIQAENVKAACNGTQLILRSSSGELRGINIKPEKTNWLNMVFDCYVGQKYDRVTRVIYLTNEVIAFDSTIGLFFFNMKNGRFYEEVLMVPTGTRAVLYQTQDSDFLLETIEPGTPIRKIRDDFDPRIGIRAIRLNGEKIPGIAKQEDLNTFVQKRGL